MNEEEDAIQHMLREHRDEIKRLPRSGIFQASDRLTAPTGPRHSLTPLPAGSQKEEEEEVPPLPPPILPPLLPENQQGHHHRCHRIHPRLERRMTPKRGDHHRRRMRPTRRKRKPRKLWRSLRIATQSHSSPL